MKMFQMPKLLEDHDYTIYAADMEFISYMPILRTVQLVARR